MLTDDQIWEINRAAFDIMQHVGFKVLHVRSELWRSKLLTRKSYEDWQRLGSKDMAQRIQERLKDIIDNHKATPLPDKVQSALKQIRQKGEAELSQ